MSANRCYKPEEGPYKPVDIRRYTNFIRGLRVSGIMLFTQKIYMYDYIRTSFLTIKMQIKKIRHAKETGKNRAQGADTIQGAAQDTVTVRSNGDKAQKSRRCYTT